MVAGFVGFFGMSPGQLQHLAAPCYLCPVPPHSSGIGRQFARLLRRWQAAMHKQSPNKNNRFLLLSVLSCAALAWPALGHAFAVSLAKQTTGAVVYWPSPKMGFWLHPACSADLPTPQCLDEVRKSFQTWAASTCTAATFADLGYSDSLKLTAIGYNTDGKNQVAWIENSAWVMGKYVLGVTSPVFYSDGTIIEADIALNGYLRTWAMTGKVNSIDVRNVMVHEIGHYFGLQHALGGYAPENPPTMAPTADPSAIAALGRKHGLRVLEDAAQAHGARILTKACGVLADAAGWSMYPGKNLGAFGDGGAITTDDDALAETLRKLRNYGSSVKYHHDLAGFNSRLDELQAALLRVRLAHLESDNLCRSEHAARYLAALAGIQGLQLPTTPEGTLPVWHLFVVRTPRRDELARYLADRGIGSQIHYPVPPHRAKAYATTHGHLELPAADGWAATCLSLPMSPHHTAAQIDEVAAAVVQFFAAPEA